MRNPSTKLTITCRNCDHHFRGRYCNLCGEKVVEPGDFRLGRILSQAFGSITNLDSKLFRTLKLLFFRPGQLSVCYVEGLRVPYMKPFQLFVIANLVFFIFLSETDLFRTPARWFFQEDFDGIRVLGQVREIMAARELSIEEVSLLYDRRSSNLAKGLIIILLPFVGLVGGLLQLRRGIPFGKHVVFATHFFTFLLLLCVLLGETLMLLPIEHMSRWWFNIPVVGLLVVYYAVGTHAFYCNRWPAAILKGVTATVLILLLIQVYRMGINLLTLYSL